MVTIFSAPFQILFLLIFYFILISQFLLKLVMSIDDNTKNYN